MKRGWACACGLLAWAAAAAEKPVPSYGDADLERLSGRRGETGVLSEPAFRAEAEPKGKSEQTQGEAYWRGEADKVRASVQKLRSAAAAARTRLETAQQAARDAAFRSAHGTASGKNRNGAHAAAPSDTRLAALEAEVKALEDEIRTREDELEFRARRARALPGWIR